MDYDGGDVCGPNIITADKLVSIHRQFFIDTLDSEVVGR